MVTRYHTSTARSSNGRSSLPVYELRASRGADRELFLEIWQLPSPATPHLRSPRRVAGLGGRNLALFEHRVSRKLAAANVNIGSVGNTAVSRFDIDEELALKLGLIFRVLAPMRNRNNMRSCADGIQAMGKEEAAYWLGMAMHRKYPRRVLMALRFLLIDPNLE